jgi:glyoxylase-like metal-dependent hydrolase (beta-lactamase superfamily II)
MSFLLSATLLSLGVVGASGCGEGDTGARGPAGPEGPPGGLDPNLSATDKLVTAMGGRPVLAGLRTLTHKSTGTRAVLDEGFLPEDEAANAATFETKVSWDFEAKHLLLEHKRVVAFPFPGAFTYNEILRADGGWRTGNDNIFGVPEGKLASERWASARRQQTFLHPEVIVREIAGGRLTTKDVGIGLVSGVLHHKVEVPGSVAPLTLWVDSLTGRLSKVTTVENEHLRGDVEVVAYYTDWKPVTGGAVLPHSALLTVDGETVLTEQRSELAANPALAATVFMAPGAVEIIDGESKRGERTHQFYEMFSSLGIPLLGGQTTIVANELVEGQVWHITGGSHHSLVVQHHDGIAVVEAPLYAERSEAIIAWIKQQFPEQPITHVVATHFHGDHSAGLRTFVAEGAAVVFGEASRELYKKVFKARRTVEPDRQATAPRQAELIGVDAGDSYYFGNGEEGGGVEVYAIDSAHAADMLIVRAAGVVFVSDIFSPGFPPNIPSLRELRDGIDRQELSVSLIAGGHGGTATMQQLRDLIGDEQPPEGAVKRVK